MRSIRPLPRRYAGLIAVGAGALCLALVGVAMAGSPVALSWRAPGGEDAVPAAATHYPKPSATTSSSGRLRAATQEPNVTQRNAAERVEPGTTHYRQLCPPPTKAHPITCDVRMRTDVPAEAANDTAPPAGYGPTDFQSAYALPSATAGAGQTIALIGWADNPNAESDLAIYRARYGLPPCTTANGCFQKINDTGVADDPPPTTFDENGEEILDEEMASAICPNCHIMVVEMGPANALQGTNVAIAAGATVVSNSWGQFEGPSGDPQPIIDFDSTYFDHPTVAMTAASGDGGHSSQQLYPAASRYVTAVGGTTLVRAATARGWNETAWSGSGSGCSTNETTKPTWQNDTGCVNKSVNDVSADADPGTGMAFYDDYGSTSAGWGVVGGTSISTPLIAGVFALAGTPPTGSKPASFPYTHLNALNDVTSGGNGTCTPAYFCTAAAGYDGPTGLGTPAGIAAFSGVPVKETVRVNTPVTLSTVLGASVHQQLPGWDTDSTKTLTYKATGLPTGLSLDAATGIASGVPTIDGVFPVTVTATDSAGVSGSGTFTWTIDGQVTGVGGLCIDDISQITTNGTPIQLWSCDQTVAQYWALTSTGELQALGKCMTIGASAAIVISDCTAAATQLWQPKSNGEFVNPGSGLCLDDPSGSGAGTHLDAIACTGAAYQRWTLPNLGTDKLTLTNPGAQTSGVGTTVKLPIVVADTAYGHPLTYTAGGLPAGLSINATTGVITGAPTAAGKATVTVHVTYTSTVTAATSFTWTTVDDVRVTSPGSQSGVLGAKVNLPIHAVDSVAGRTLTYSAPRLPGGLTISATTGVITGTLTAGGVFSAKVTVKDNGGLSTSVYFAWTVVGPIIGYESYCADDVAQGTTNGNPIQLWACNQTVAQMWTVATNGELQVLGHCLTVAGTAVGIATCTGASTQIWQPGSNATLVNTGTKKCLDDPGSGGEGTHLDVATCTSGANQRWTLP